MKIEVVCESTNRHELLDQPIKVFANFGSAGAGQGGKLISGTEMTLLLKSTELDKIGWIKSGRKYEVEIREINQ